jgi:Arylsulfatase A and related enzymes
MMNDRGLPGYKGDLGNDVRTIAEVMKTADYSTYLSGKWHVTPKIRPGDSQHNWPRQRGFDRFYGTIHGAGSFFDPNSLTRGNTLISPYADPEYKPKTFYYTDAINDHAAKFITEHKGDDPFFLYVAHTAPHWPMHALPEDMAKYKGRYDDGWEAMRKARYERQLKMGLIDEKWKLSPRDGAAWKDAPDKEWEIRLMGGLRRHGGPSRLGAGQRRFPPSQKGKMLDDTLILFPRRQLGDAPRVWAGKGAS